jgi:hypothetical protein
MSTPWSNTTLLPCGTHAAYRRHIRRGEPVDGACTEARRKYQRDNGRRPSPATQAARAAALEVLAHRHPEEFRRLYAAELRDQTSKAGAA